MKVHLNESTSWKVFSTLIRKQAAKNRSKLAVFLAYLLIQLSCTMAFTYYFDHFARLW